MGKSIEKEKDDWLTEGKGKNKWKTTVEWLQNLYWGGSGNAEWRGLPYMNGILLCQKWME